LNKKIFGGFKDLIYRFVKVKSISENVLMRIEFYSMLIIFWNKRIFTFTAYCKMLLISKKIEYENKF